MFTFNLRKTVVLAIAMLVISTLQLACSSNDEVLPSTNLGTACIEDFQEGIDYFPEKASISYAQNFSIEYHDYFKVLKIPEGTKTVYVLVQCGAPKPPLTGPLADAEIIQIPIKTIFTSSTAQIPALVDVERVEVLTGHAQTSLVVSPLSLIHI